MLDPLFSGGAIDRASNLRPRAEDLARDPAALALPLWRGKPLFDTEAAPRPVWLTMDDPLLADAAEPPVLLGAEAGAARFAVDVSHLADAEEARQPVFLDRATLDLSETRKFVELRAVMGELDPIGAGDLATAKGVLEWHRTHPRCARCGAPTVMRDAGWRRGCPDCGAEHFPRTDPVTIMLVVSGDRALLGRQAAWPDGMYSLLAGFMEPGETIEDAARREVLEEAGVPVGRVRYLCSQPWPFPASLMIGVACEALGDEISRDDLELEDALWADRAEVAASLRGEPARFSAARKGAVARTILEAWVRGEA